MDAVCLGCAAQTYNGKKGDGIFRAAQLKYCYSPG